MGVYKLNKQMVKYVHNEQNKWHCTSNNKKQNKKKKTQPTPTEKKNRIAKSWQNVEFSFTF